MPGQWGGARPNSGPKSKSGATKPAAKGATPTQRKAAGKELVKIGLDALLTAKKKPGPRLNPFIRANHPPSVFPKGHRITMAQDEAINQSLAWSAGIILNGMFSEGIGFLGYPYLAELTQRAEYRVISETIAVESTREWIEIKATSVDAEGVKKPKPGEEPPPGAADRAPGEKPEPKLGEQPAVEGDDPDAAEKKANDKTEKIKALEAEFDRLKVRDVFRKACEQDGFFGRSHIYIDIEGARDDRDELLTSIGNGRNETSKVKVQKGSLKRLQNVEPLWCYPSVYNATDPLAPGWYNPQMWFCMGKELHQSRLLMFVGREVPDLLKPAYSFGGLSLSQIAKPYVDNWLRTRQSVADIVHAFSVMVLSTDLSESLSGAGDELFRRLDFFNATRDNRGIMAVNKDTEALTNVSAPLSSLDLLQAQTQEHMAAVSKIPIVKLLGIQPAGLNASSEGEIKTFDDTIAAFQEKFFGEALRRILGFAQLNLWGEIDDEITAVFKPLRQMTEKERGEIAKQEAESDQIRIDTGVLHPEEVRRALAAEEDSRYSDIDVEDVPEPPAEPGMGEEGGGLPFGGGGGDDPSGGGPGGEGGGPPAKDALFNDPDRDTQNWLDSTRWPKNAAKVEITIHLDPTEKRRDEGAGGGPSSEPEGGEPGGEDAALLPFVEPAEKTLYLHRPLKNAATFLEWARASGFKKTLPADDIHVTIAFSKTPIDWDSVPGAPSALTVPAGADRRTVKTLGDKGAVVLGFSSEDLQRRWKELRDVGTSWDYPTYQPHVTITYDGGDIDLASIEPYRGPLEFGPEEGSEIKEKWFDKAKSALVGADEFNEADHPRGQPENAGQFGSGGGGGAKSKKAPDPEKPGAKAAPAAASSSAKESPEPSEGEWFKTKKEQIGHLLTKGTTSAEILKATGWPSVSVPAQAKALGYKLEKIKEGGVTKYKGTPMTPAELKAAGITLRSGPRGPRTNGDNLSLLQHLAATGGIRNDDPLVADVRAIIGRDNLFIPGFGQLIRKPRELSTAAQRGGGTAPRFLDQLRESSVEAKYLADAGEEAGRVAEATVRTLLDAISQELRGKRIYPQGTQAENLSEHDIENLAQEETDRRQGYSDELDSNLEEVGFKRTDVPDNIRNRVVELMLHEGVQDALEAYERAVMEETTDATESGAAERIQDFIPGWDVPDDAGAAPGAGEAPAGGKQT